MAEVISAGEFRNGLTIEFEGILENLVLDLLLKDI